ncbi:hypothetical protein FRC03_005675 [Tulasnella sp. 419]|nr:hypothetical protein FRC03_005675 [Tulasnella sp. 419]
MQAVIVLVMCIIVVVRFATWGSFGCGSGQPPIRPTSDEHHVGSNQLWRNSDTVIIGLLASAVVKRFRNRSGLFPLHIINPFVRVLHKPGDDNQIGYRTLNAAEVNELEEKHRRSSHKGRNKLMKRQEALDIPGRASRNS